MYLGIGSFTFPWAIGTQGLLTAQKISWIELLQFAMAHEIKYVQFGDNLPLHSLTKKELIELKERADQYGIRLQAGTRGLTTDNIETYLSIAEIIESPFIRVVIDNTDYEPSESEVIDLISKLLPQLKQKKIMLAIENHDRFSSLTLQKIIAQTDPQWIGICLDTANSFGAGEGINEVLNVLAPYTVNLHIKDISIKRVSHKMGFNINGRAAGDGMLDIPAIINRLHQTGKCSTGTLEIWSDEEDTIDLTVLKEKQLAEKSIHYLKKILL